MYVGNTIQLTGTVNPSNTTEITLWTSSNTDVATVSDTGLVTAKSAGTATITFKNSSGTKLDSCTVMVCEEEEIVYIVGSIVPGSTSNSDGYYYYNAALVKGKVGVWRDEISYQPRGVSTLENGNIVSAYTLLKAYPYEIDKANLCPAGGMIKINDIKTGNTISILGKNKSTGYSCVTSSKDGGFFVGDAFDYKNSNSSNKTGPVNIYKYNSFGKIQWTYNITQSEIGSVQSISETQDNEVVFHCNGYIYKLNENGTLEWKIRGSSSIAVLPNGNIATITGSTLKILNSSGNEVLNTEIDSAFSCIATSLDNYIYLAEGGIVAKYDTNGEKIWQKSVNTDFWTRGAYITAIATFSDGSVVVGTGNNSELVKYDKNGNLIFKKTLGSSPVQDITIVKE